VNYSVLVVDDYEPWRRRVAAELGKSARWRVIGELEDGVDAVREAKARRPDVILLDIGMQRLNGVDAARRIFADDPKARILFLTGQSSPEIAEVALATGAAGYLLKPEAGRSLLLALESVAAGGRFVSRGLPAELADVTRDDGARSGHRHDAVFHADEAALVNDYARFAEAALAAGQPTVVVSASHRLEKVRRQLESRGVAVGDAVRDRRYAAFDAGPELARLMVNGQLQSERCREDATAIIEQAAREAGGRRVAVCGDVAPNLWKEGLSDAAIQVERIWDAAAGEMGFDLLCGYLIDEARLAEDDYSVFRSICSEHGTVHVR
jgi:DNA-binding NarL/FixJ family response regulator